MVNSSMQNIINMVDIYKVNQNFKFNSYNLRHGTRVWYLNGTRIYDNNIPVWFTVASSSSKEELLVWADINSIKIDYES